MKASGILTDDQATEIMARTEAVNSAGLTRQINQNQLRLTDLSQDKTEAMTASPGLDMTSWEPSIHRL